MIKKENREFYSLALTEWGEDSQLRMCIEEMSELTKEICKYIRHLKCDNAEGHTEKLAEIKENIKEEIADVINTAEQLAFIFGEDEIDKIRDRKMKRELNRLKVTSKKNQF